MIDNKPHRLATKATIIGIDEDSEYENAEIQVPKNSDLYIFSDGIYEIKKINKEMMHLEEFIAFLVEAQACKDKNCQSFIRSIEKQSITGGFEDDVSLLHLHFN
jgi:sigma-B regulation protein RsbU (phosphoserine phosphatase)